MTAPTEGKDTTVRVNAKAYKALARHRARLSLSWGEHYTFSQTILDLVRRVYDEQRK